MELLDLFLSYNFILLSLAISAIVYMIRILVDLFWDNNDNKYWKASLNIMPILIGALLGLVCGKFAFPAEIVSISSKVLFSIVAGLFSSSVYALIKKLIESKQS
jgi:hypothetical protein